MIYSMPLQRVSITNKPFKKKDKGNRIEMSIVEFEDTVPCSNISIGILTQSIRYSDKPEVCAHTTETPFSADLSSSHINAISH